MSRISMLLHLLTLQALLLPHWLPIYHTGTGQVALISAAKIFAFAFFGFSAAVIAPAFYDVGIAAAAAGSSPYLQYMLPATIIAAASLPLYVTTLTSTAMVTYVHIALPPVARRSRSTLEAWARRIPNNTRVLMTTQRASLNAKQTETCMAELSTRLPGLRQSTWFGRNDPAREGMRPGDSARAGVSLKAASASPPSAAPLPKNQSDLQIFMQRQRLPGWQPPATAGRLSWFTKEPRTFVVRIRSNKSKEFMVWDRFVEQIGR
jgi:hypothetical protein